MIWVFANKILLAVSISVFVTIFVGIQMKTLKTVTRLLEFSKWVFLHHFNNCSARKVLNNFHVVWANYGNIITLSTKGYIATSYMKSWFVFVLSIFFVWCLEAFCCIKAFCYWTFVFFLKIPSAFPIVLLCQVLDCVRQIISSPPPNKVYILSKALSF